MQQHHFAKDVWMKHHVFTNEIASFKFFKLSWRPDQPAKIASCQFVRKVKRKRNQSTTCFGDFMTNSIIVPVYRISMRFFVCLCFMLLCYPMIRADHSKTNNLEKNTIYRLDLFTETLKPNPKDLPQQNNKFDCRPYCLLFSNLIARNQDILGHYDVKALRKEMRDELLHSQHNPILFC